MDNYHYPGDIYSDAQWQWVAQKVAEGYTKKQLADFLGLDYREILPALRLRGLAYPRPTEPQNSSHLGIGSGCISVILLLVLVLLSSIIFSFINFSIFPHK